MKKIEEVKILAGPHKGYTGYIVNVNAFKRVYSILIEANGKYVNVPIEYTKYISEHSPEDLFIQDVPRNYTNIEDQIVYNSIEDSPLEKDVMDNDEGVDNIDLYLETVQGEVSKQASKRKRSSDDKQEYLRGYNEAYVIKNENQDINYLNTNYNAQDRQYIKMIKQNLEDICQSLGYEITGHPLNFYYTHSDEILNLINDTKHKIYSKEQYLNLKNKTHIEFVKGNNSNSFPNEYISKGLKNYIKVDENILKVISSTYMYYFINNNGIKSYNNINVMNILKQNGVVLSSRNYYIASLQYNKYFNDSPLNSKMIEEASGFIGNMQQLIEKSSEYYILNETMLQSTQMPYVIKKQDSIAKEIQELYKERKYKPVNLKKNLLKFKVVKENEQDLTKRIQIKGLNNPTFLEVQDIIYRDNINLLHSQILGVYLEYNKLFSQTYKIDFHDYIIQDKINKSNGDNKGVDKIINNKDLVGNLKFLYNLLNTSKDYAKIDNKSKLDNETGKIFLNKYMNSRLEIQDEKEFLQNNDITLSLQKSILNVYNNYSEYCRKEISSAINDIALHQSLSKVKLSTKQDSYKKYTHDKLKRLISDQYKQVSDSNNLKKTDTKAYLEIQYVISNFDNIIEGNVSSKDSLKYKGIIEETKKIYTNNNNILLYGRDISGKSSESIKQANKYHKNEFFKIESQELKRQKMEIPHLPAKQEPIPRKNAEAINKVVHNLIDGDAKSEKEIDIKKYNQQLIEMKLIKNMKSDITNQRFKNIEKNILESTSRRNNNLQAIEYQEPANVDDNTKYLINLINKSFK